MIFLLGLIAGICLAIDFKDLWNGFNLFRYKRWLRKQYKRGRAIKLYYPIEGGNNETDL